MRTINLCWGKGKEGESHCVMAATSIVAGERFSDHPKCVCPTITEPLIRTNDRCKNDAMRNELLSHLPWVIIGTRGNMKHMKKRAEMFAEYAGIDPVGNLKSQHSCVATADRAVAVTLDAAEKTLDTEFLKNTIKKLVRFIEEEIVPVYTTMTVEPGYRIDELICVE